MSEANGRIERILIVGGGVAGWMAAAYLHRFLRGTGASVTLLESIKLGTSSVGEASDPALVRFVRRLQLDEAEVMRQCSATFQVGTRFFDWTADGSSYWHPFGLCGGTINDIDLFPFWLKSVRAGRKEGPYSSYSLQTLVGEQEKSPRPVRGPSPIVERGEYAYHLDPAFFADVLRELATTEGVNHLFDDVRQVVRNEQGLIAGIETRSGRALAADLYLDCTAEGLLMEQGLGDAWVSWSHLLPCDRAVVLPLGRDPAMPPYVRCTALSAGWMRHVPLSHRVACSYFYSSAHLQTEAATRELLARATPNRASAAEPRYLTLRNGRRQTFWLGNCLALGPAAASLEPLEATDFLLIQKMLEWLVELFPDRSFQEVLRRTYNERVAALHDSVRDFLLLHYLLSRREDQPFWRDSKKIAVPESLQALMALHDENGTVAPGPNQAFPETSYHHLFAGGDRLPRRVALAAGSLDFARVCEVMAKMRAQNDEWLAKLPLHRELLALLHQPPV